MKSSHIYAHEGAFEQQVYSSFDLLIKEQVIILKIDVATVQNARWVVSVILYSESQENLSCTYQMKLYANIR